MRSDRIAKFNLATQFLELILFINLQLILQVEVIYQEDELNKSRQLINTLKQAFQSKNNRIARRHSNPATGKVFFNLNPRVLLNSQGNCTLNILLLKKSQQTMITPNQFNQIIFEATPDIKSKNNF
ncbi:hypothetical protein ABPG74_008747 [Tetrahymena malaccensis]